MATLAGPAESVRLFETNLAGFKVEAESVTDAGLGIAMGALWSIGSVGSSFWAESPSID